MILKNSTFHLWANSAQMTLIPEELTKAGFKEAEKRKICHENYLRVLELGWSK
jgi:microsomal dipeptidase-like Zn-dependent dipeptidase